MHAFGYTGVNDATHRLESYGRMQFFSATFSETFLVPLLVHVQDITHNSNSINQSIDYLVVILCCISTLDSVLSFDSCFCLRFIED
jgi:hypothetical protein